MSQKHRRLSRQRQRLAVVTRQRKIKIAGLCTLLTILCAVLLYLNLRTPTPIADAPHGLESQTSTPQTYPEKAEEIIARAQQKGDAETWRIIWFASLVQEGNHATTIVAPLPEVAVTFLRSFAKNHCPSGSHPVRNYEQISEGDYTAHHLRRLAAELVTDLQNGPSTLAFLIPLVESLARDKPLYWSPFSSDQSTVAFMVMDHKILITRSFMSKFIEAGVNEAILRSFLLHELVHYYDTGLILKEMEWDVGRLSFCATRNPGFETGFLVWNETRGFEHQFTYLRQVMPTLFNRSSCRTFTECDTLMVELINDATTSRDRTENFPAVWEAIHRGSPQLWFAYMAKYVDRHLYPLP